MSRSNSGRSKRDSVASSMAVLHRVSLKRLSQSQPGNDGENMPVYRLAFPPAPPRPRPGYLGLPLAPPNLTIRVCMRLGCRIAHLHRMEVAVSLPSSRGHQLMDAPSVPRRRLSPARDRHNPPAASRWFSMLTAVVPQYPSQQADGKRELKAAQDRPHTASSSRERRATPSIDHTMPVPRHPFDSPSADAINEPLPGDLPERYSAQSLRSVVSTENVYRPKGSPMPDPTFEASATTSARSTADFHTPLEFSRRHVNIPTRTSSTLQSQQPQAERRPSLPPTAESRGPSSPEPADDSRYRPGERSSGDSVFSQETRATSIHTLPALQPKDPGNQFEPVVSDDPRSFDLLSPAQNDQELGIYALEKRAEQMLSAAHLRIIFEDPRLLLKFTGFLNSHRPKSLPVLIYYLDALKAIRAINYANAIAEALEPMSGHAFSTVVAKSTQNVMLQEKAAEAFDVLVREDLPAYIAHTWISVVSVSIQRRIIGTLAPHLREASEGLAEVFCLSDPSRTDNPIVFASEEFVRMTQYGMNYAIGRNCRFLQGPRTNSDSVRRLAAACQEGRELTEVFVNYRRDGSPFMNLLMIAPLMDSRGNVRYFIGAQVDVSGLIKDCAELDGLTKLVERERELEEGGDEGGEEETSKKDEFQDLAEMFNGTELESVRRFGGRMHKEYTDESETESMRSGRRRVVLKDLSQDALDDRARSSYAHNDRSHSMTKERINSVNGKLEGIYEHYLLVRPAPSLRILFTSPSLRVPGILQSPFLNRIGGSSRVRSDLAGALGEGRGVTAKIRWLTKADDDGEGEGRPRWIHCTPLLGHSGTVGVWMVVLVDDESSPRGSTGRRFRNAPPVATNIGGKEWEGHQSRPRDRKQLNAYDKDGERRGDVKIESDYFPMPSGASVRSAQKGSHVANQMNRTRDPSRTGISSRHGTHDSNATTDTADFSFGLKSTTEPAGSNPAYAYGDGL